MQNIKVIMDLFWRPNTFLKIFSKFYQSFWHLPLPTEYSPKIWIRFTAPMIGMKNCLLGTDTTIPVAALQPSRTLASSFLCQEIRNESFLHTFYKLPFALFRTFINGFCFLVLRRTSLSMPLVNGFIFWWYLLLVLVRFLIV